MKKLQVLYLYICIKFLGLKAGLVNKLSDLRDIFGKIINLFSDELKDYNEIPRLRKKKNFQKHLKDLKSSHIEVEDITNFATLDQLMGFV